MNNRVLYELEYDILGSHALTKITGASFDNLNDKKRLEVTFNLVIGLFELCPISDPIIHQFNPYGLTGIVLLSESHISIHTWPELGSATLDVFTCGDRPSEDIANYFAECLVGEDNYKTELIYR